VARGAARAPQIDIVSGATVTVLVMGDSIVRSASKLIKSGRIGAKGSAVADAAAQTTKTIDADKSERRDWPSLLGDGSVRRLLITVADVNAAFEKSGQCRRHLRDRNRASRTTSSSISTWRTSPCRRSAAVSSAMTDTTAWRQD
jgi:transcriptional regulator of nitric oxide reductase